MPTTTYDYATVRVVPRVDRDEFVNAGVIVYSAQKKFLEARIMVDEARLKALWPSLDVESVKKHLHAISLICAGDSSGGAIAQLPQKERFYWLTSPRSAVRTGISSTPAAVLEHLTDELVAVG